MGFLGVSEKPHAVCVPFPAQGHINPMLKLLHSRGFHITFVNSEFNHQRLLKSRHPNSLQGFHILSPCESTTTTCLVSDGAMTFTLEAAEELRIPGVVFWTASACGFLACIQCAKLIEMGCIKDLSYLTNGYLDTVVDGIPGMKGIRLRDFPSFIRTTSLDDFMIKFMFNETNRARKI